MPYMGAMDGLAQPLIALAQVVMIDVALAGDNAIVVGMAASRVAADVRRRVILWGIGGAVLLRVVFAVITTRLFDIIGLTLAGGIILLWVCWKMFRELRGAQEERAAVEGSTAAPQKRLPVRAAVGQIILADLSMSLDNVLAVAGAAKDHLEVLVIGLGLSILLMAVTANFVAKLLVRYPWISWVGLAIVLYVAIEMIWRGSFEVAAHAAALDRL